MRLPIWVSITLDSWRGDSIAQEDAFIPTLTCTNLLEKRMLELAGRCVFQFCYLHFCNML